MGPRGRSRTSEHRSRPLVPGKDLGLGLEADSPGSDPTRPWVDECDVGMTRDTTRSCTFDDDPLNRELDDIRRKDLRPVSALELDQH